MQSYLHYLEQVLGLKSLIWPEAKAPEPTSATTTESCLVLFVVPSELQPRSQELFDKMREAMKLPATQTRLVVADQMSLKDLQLLGLTARHVVCFSKDLFAQFQAEEMAKSLTHHPDELLKRPELKKETWEDLKKVIRIVQT